MARSLHNRTVDISATHLLHLKVLLFTPCIEQTKECGDWLCNGHTSDQPGDETVAREARVQLHLLVRFGDKKTVLPMHGKNHELPRGTANGIKRSLGLK